MEANGNLNSLWEQRVKDGGADFVRFVDITGFPREIVGGYTCALLFGKALSKGYIAALRDEREPERKEVLNVERKMDALAVKIAAELTQAGYESVGKLKTGLLPHKTIALRAGLGFIGKNNLLVTPEYGCAQMLGKVLTKAPFEAACQTPKDPQCGDCHICADVCPTCALLGTTWNVGKTRDEIITRKKCVLCVKCMAFCPYTGRYAGDLGADGVLDRP